MRCSVQQHLKPPNSGKLIPEAIDGNSPVNCHAAIIVMS